MTESRPTVVNSRVELRARTQVTSPLLRACILSAAVMISSR